MSRSSERIFPFRELMFLSGETHKYRSGQFDGITIPYPDASFDAVMFVDVLHHTVDPFILLREGKRVAKTVLIKDHFRDGMLSGPTLRFMDWVGNVHHGVALPYNYWSRLEWTAAFKASRLEVSEMKTSLGLYPQPASWMFERSLHFVARLERAEVAHPVSLRSDGAGKI